MGLSVQHLLLLLVVVLVLFGRGKISALMGDIGKGIKSFRKGLEEDDKKPPSQPAPSPQRADGAERDAVKSW